MRSSAAFCDGLCAETVDTAAVADAKTMTSGVMKRRNLLCFMALSTSFANLWLSRSA
jgi:hypothetical protein